MSCNFEMLTKKLINTYNKFFISRAINVPLTEKLNTFWIVVSQSGLMDVDTMPDSMKCKNILSNLMSRRKESMRNYKNDE